MQRSLVELLEVYGRLNHYLGSKQTYLHQFYKGKFDTLESFELERELKDLRAQIKSTRDMIDEQLEIISGVVK